MSGSLKIIAEYGTPEEAHLLRNRLEAAGIQGFLENETTASAWHLSNALGGVKLLVAQEDLEAAREVLALSAGQPTAAAARAEGQLRWYRPPESWTCPKCRAQVDAGMDVCWACGTTAEGMEVAEFEHESLEAEPKEERAPPPDVAFLTVLFPPTFAYFVFSKLCHLLAPLVPDAKHHASAGTLAAEDALGPEAGDARVRPWGHEGLRKGTVPFSLRENRDSPQGVCRPPLSEEPDSTSEEELDALVLRAWRAALVGFFQLPPLVMTLYSTWLVVQYWFARRRANRPRDRRALWTLAVNIFAALFLGVLLSLAIGSYYDSTSYEPGTIGPAEQEPAPYLEP